MSDSGLQINSGVPTFKAESVDRKAGTMTSTVRYLFRCAGSSILVLWKVLEEEVARNRSRLLAYVRLLGR